MSDKAEDKQDAFPSKEVEDKPSPDVVLDPAPPEDSAAQNQLQALLLQQQQSMSSSLVLSKLLAGNITGFESVQHKQQFEWLLMELLQAKQEIENLAMENMQLRQQNTKVHDAATQGVPNDQFARQVLQSMRSMHVVPYGGVEQVQNVQHAAGGPSEADANTQNLQKLMTGSKAFTLDPNNIAALETIASSLASSARTSEAPLSHMNLVQPVTPAKVEDYTARYNSNVLQKPYSNIVKPEPTLPKIGNNVRSMSPPFRSSAPNPEVPNPRKRKAKRGNVKVGKKSGRGLNLPRPAVKALKKWLYENFDNPYPTEVEKRKLADELGLDHVQVNTWFINARMRLWKPIVEKLFFAMKDRMEKQVEQESDCTPQEKEDIQTMLEQFKKVQEAEDVRAKVAFMMMDAKSKQIMQEATAKLSSKNESESCEI